MPAESSPLLARVAAGESQELLRLAAQGLLPVAPEELIPLQVQLACGDDDELAAAAGEALRSIDPRVVANFLAGDASADEMAYFALEVGNAVVISAILRRRDAPRELLSRLAGRLPPDLQELLLLRQDAIVEAPAILDELAANPALSTYARRRIAEYREHLLPRERTTAEEEAEAGSGPDEADDETVRQAIAAVQRQPAAGDVEDTTGLTEGQIRLLTVPVRMRLARGAQRMLRAILIRDPHPRVAVAVLKVNPVSDQEVEQIASSRLVVQEVFEAIYARRQWIGKYPILRTLAFNPRVPVALGVKLVPRLSLRDLRVLGRDHNVPDAIRSMAQRLYKIKRI